MNNNRAVASTGSNNRDTFYTLQNLYTVLKIFGLDCTYRNCANLESRFSYKKTLTAIFFIGTLNAVFLYLKFSYFYEGVHPTIKATDTFQCAYDHLQYIIDIYFVHKFGRSCKLEYLNYYKTIDNFLHFKNFEELKKEINGLFAVFIAAVVLSSGLDFGTWTLGFGWKEPVIFGVIYIYTFIKTLSFIDLMANVLNVEYRLNSLCENLENYYTQSGYANKMTYRDPVMNKKWVHEICFGSKKVCNSSSDGTVSWVCGSTFKSNSLLTKCYLLLSEQCAFINKMFGVRILLNCLSLLVEMIRLLNLAIRNISGTQQTLYKTYGLPGVANIVRFAVYWMLLLSLVHCCERSYRQRDRLQRLVDHTLVNKDIDAESRRILEEFRSLVSSKPLEFHLNHFCRLDYSLLTSLASVVVTYTIILSQN